MTSAGPAHGVAGRELLAREHRRRRASGPARRSAVRSAGAAERGRRVGMRPPRASVAPPPTASTDDGLDDERLALVDEAEAGAVGRLEMRAHRSEQRADAVVPASDARIDGHLERVSVPA